MLPANSLGRALSGSSEEAESRLSKARPGLVVHTPTAWPMYRSESHGPAKLSARSSAAPLTAATAGQPPTSGRRGSARAVAALGASPAAKPSDAKAIPPRAGNSQNQSPDPCTIQYANVA